jgi:hypothetical protein
MRLLAAFVIVSLLPIGVLSLREREFVERGSCHLKGFGGARQR